MAGWSRAPQEAWCLTLSGCQARHPGREVTEPLDFRFSNDLLAEF